MCTNCHLTTPLGVHELCHACSLRLRADARRGVAALEEYLELRRELERWLDDLGG